MKRSRTCMNLVELDAPAAPKRTCSLPNLAWNSTPAGSGSSIPRQNHRDTLLFFQQHAASTLSRGAAATAPPTATAAEGSFVVESIVRSKGSLNEITIVEGQQFIGEETAAPSVPQCSAAGGSPVTLFGGAVQGSLFEDCGDSSDYFCGVASSDEAEEDGTDAVAAVAAVAVSVAGATTTVTASTDAAVSDGGDSGACFARQVSDADSNAGISCARQISDASSSSSSSSSSAGSSSGGDSNVGYAFEGDADEADDVIATGADADAAYAPPASLSRSLPTLAAQPWGSDTLPVMAGPHAGGSWRPRTAGGPRVKVRICSPRPGGGDSGRRQRSMTVPPPWPPAVVPPPAVMNGWRGEPATTRSDNRQQQQQQQQQQRRRLRYLDVCDNGNDNEDGSLVSAVALGFGLSDDAKMLIGMDRLRLVDPETASY